MANWLRIFLIVCFLLVFAAVFFGGNYAKRYVEDNIIRVFSHQINEISIFRFTREFWYPNRRTLNRLPCIQAECPQLAPMATAFDNYFASLPFVVKRLYRNDERAENLFDKTFFFSLDSTDEAAKQAFDMASKGNVSSYLAKNIVLNGQTYSVVRTFYPVILNAGEDSMQRIPAVLEVAYDVSPFLNKIGQWHWFIIVGMSVFFLLLFTAIFIASYNMEKVVSRQYEANQKLKTAKSSAEEENEAKSLFLANISHELRTPLNAIIGFSEIIKDEVMGPINNQQYKDYITDIHVSGAHLLGLINDILDYSKADAGKLTIDMEEVDVTKIMRNSIRLVLPRAQEAGVELISGIPKEHYVLHTDGKRLKQVILNLLSNSVKFTEEGGKVTLNAWNDLTNNSFMIEVEDTGVGIAAKDISKVMATFGQAENKLSRKYEGTGLGLPLTKKLVELMGGKFDIKSEVGVGTRVTISLPYIEQTEEDTISGVGSQS